MSLALAPPLEPTPSLHLVGSSATIGSERSGRTRHDPMIAPRARVLVVDDDEDVVVLVRALLAPDDIDVDWAPDHDSAIDAVRKALYAVLLIDYDLGSSDGVRLMRELQMRGHDAPMLLLTGSSDPSVDAAALRAGASNFLSKDELSGRGLARAIRYARERHLDLSRARQLADSMRREASTDALTGLGNRRAFDLELAALVEGDDAGCLLMIDLDGLKAVNDALGHVGGDAAIRAVADRIAETIRAGDAAYRFGGDEFAVLARGLGLRSFRHRMADHLGRVDGPAFVVSASVGWAEREADDTSASLLDRADRRLYLSKLAGRVARRAAISAATAPGPDGDAE